MINQAISFEFSLLETDEKRLILLYFEIYNGLEDEVQWLLPKATRRQSDSGVPEEILQDDKETLTEGLHNLFSLLRRTYQMAGDVITLLIDSDGGEFPNFRSKLDQHEKDGKVYGFVRRSSEDIRKFHNLY